jgi:hypothetical protein
MPPPKLTDWVRLVSTVVLPPATKAVAPAPQVVSLGAADMEGCVGGRAACRPGRAVSSTLEPTRAVVPALPSVSGAGGR